MTIDNGPPVTGRPWSRASQAARWVAPGASQIISSVGNSLLAFAAARWMGGADFGAFILAYSGVLLVSQLFRVAVGEAGLLSATDADERGRAAPMLLGAALALTPLLGVAGFAVALVASGGLGFSVATGVAICVVSSTEIGRYALLSRGLVRRAVRLDVTWTLTELVLLVAFRAPVLSSPTGLLWCWTTSALVALLPAIVAVRPSTPRASVVHVFTNHHWWRLTLNEALVTATGYVVLALLAILGSTSDVGAVRASMLPFQWVQLAIASAWLVVLSRQPSGKRLQRMVVVLHVVLLSSIALAVVVIELIPDSFGVRLLRDNWAATQQLAVFAGATYAALTLAEIGVLRLKASKNTGLVLRVRVVGSITTLSAAMVLLWSPTSKTAMTAMIIGQLTTAVMAINWRHRPEPSAEADLR